MKQLQPKLWAVGNRLPIVLLLLVLGLVPSTNAQDTEQKKKKVFQEFSGEAKLDYRIFPSEGLYEGQKQSYFSAAVEPEYLLEWKGGKHSIKFRGFGRLDQHDSRRTHVDVREFYWLTYKKNVEFSVGAKKIYWGVTESIHLVDIINQTDQIESFDGEQKLGQPMVHFSYQSKVGTFSVFYLPFFRKRVFPGVKGRLRTPFIIDTDDIGFTSSLEEWHPDAAARWSHYMGPVDLGVSFFRGTSREPLFTGFTEDGSFAPVYAIVNRPAIDFQLTTGPVLWKAEVVYTESEVQDFIAFAAGLEYTFGNVFNSGLDIGLLSEYIFDERDELAISGLQNDIFVGMRLAFNDRQSTEFLIGAIFDAEHSTKLFSAEGSRRIGDMWKITIEGRMFAYVSPKEFTYLLRDDDFIQVTASMFF